MAKKKSSKTALSSRKSSLAVRTDLLGDIRTLRHKIGHLLYERTAVAKKPDVLIKQDLAALRDEDRLTPDMVFRDPYFLDFLGLTGHHVELLRLNDSGIRVAQYLTELPPKKLLEKKLHQAIQLARERLARSEQSPKFRSWLEGDLLSNPGIVQTRADSSVSPSYGLFFN